MDLRKLKPGSSFDNLYTPLAAEVEADWLVGLNATRAFTVQHGTMLSVGRVQTLTLAIPLLAVRKKFVALLRTSGKYRRTERGFLWEMAG